MPCARRKRAGFTLVELVVVVLVLGLLAAVAVPRLLNTATQAKANGTRESLRVVRDALESYRAEHGGFPPAESLSATLKPYLRGPFPRCEIGNANDSVAASSANPLVVASGGAGWVYNSSTGDFAVNHADGILW